MSESREAYVVTDLPSTQFAIERMAERLDRLEGLKERSTYYETKLSYDTDSGTGFAPIAREVVTHITDDTIGIDDMQKVHVFDCTDGDKRCNLTIGSALNLMDWVTVTRKGGFRLQIFNGGDDSIIIAAGTRLMNKETRYMSAITLQLVETDYWHPVGGASFGVWEVR